MLTITVIIIAITVLISFTAFNNDKIMNDFIFYPPAVTNNNQYYRFITCGLIHADYGHLLFNMFALWMFGRILEQVWGPKRFLLYYLVTGLGAAFFFGAALAAFAFFALRPPPMPARAFSSSIADAIVTASTCVPLGTEALVSPSVTYGP